MSRPIPPQSSRSVRRPLKSGLQFLYYVLVNNKQVAMQIARAGLHQPRLDVRMESVRNPTKSFLLFQTTEK